MKKTVYILAALLSLSVVSCTKDFPGKKPTAVDIGMVLTREDGTQYTLKWASWNLGAKYDYDPGCYYSWGELSVKND